MNSSTKRFMFFRLISIIYTCMFPACCFRQIIFSNFQVFFLDVAPGHMNNASNETQIHLCRFVSRKFCKFCIGIYRGQCLMIDHSCFSLFLRVCILFSLVGIFLFPQTVFDI